MIKTIIIHGSNEVLAPCGSFGTLIRGKRQTIKVTKVDKDENVPLSARKALVGMDFLTIFSSDQLGIDKVPKGAMVAYAEEVIEALEKENKKKAAEDLRKILPNRLDMWVFEPSTFEIIE